ncbi:polysaccharide biosynthesis protein, partial [Candidatus Omnitrophota bacterium]
ISTDEVIEYTRPLSLPLFKLFGARIRIHWSMVFLPLVLGLIFKTGTPSWFVYTVFCGFMLSIGIHAFAHVYWMKRKGVDTQYVLVTPIGFFEVPELGFIKHKDKSGMHWAGPLASIILFIFFLAVYDIAEIINVAKNNDLQLQYNYRAFRSVVLSLVYANAAIAAFNLFPAYPTDGGQAVAEYVRRKWGHVKARFVTKIGIFLSLTIAIAGLLSGKWLIAALGLGLAFLGPSTLATEQLVRKGTKFVDAHTHRAVLERDVKREILQKEESIHMYLSSSSSRQYIIDRTISRIRGLPSPIRASLLFDKNAPIDALSFRDIVVTGGAQELACSLKMTSFPAGRFRLSYEFCPLDASPEYCQIDFINTHHRGEVIIRDLNIPTKEGTLKLWVSRLDACGSPCRIVYESSSVRIGLADRELFRVPVPLLQRQVWIVKAVVFMFLGILFLLYIPLLIPFCMYTGIKYRQIFYEEKRYVRGRDGEYRLGVIRKIMTLSPLLADKKKVILGWYGRLIKTLKADEIPQAMLILTGKWAIFGPRALSVTPHLTTAGVVINDTDAPERYHGEKPGILNTVTAMHGYGSPICCNMQTRLPYDKFDTCYLNLSLAVKVFISFVLALMLAEGIEEYRGRQPPREVRVVWRGKKVSEPPVEFESQRQAVYFPRVGHSGFAEEHAARIIWPQGDEEQIPFRQHLGPVHTDINDYVSTERQKEISSLGLSYPHSVLIAIPTNHPCVLSSLCHIEDEVRRIKNKHPNWKVTVAFAVNGAEEKTRAVLTEALKDAQRSLSGALGGAGLVVIDIPMDGKNNAMNVLADFAKAQNCNILTFVDDDVRFSEGALLSGIEVLLESRKICLVGARLKFHKGTNFWERLTASVKNREELTRPLGCHNVLYTESYPGLPSFSISADVYLPVVFMDDASKNPFERIIVDHSATVEARSQSSLYRYLLVLTRFEYHRALSKSLLGDKYRMLDSKHYTIAGSALKRGLRNILSPKEAGYLLIFLTWGIVRMAVRIFVSIELALRKLHNLPKLKVKWRADPYTKDFYSSKSTGCFAGVVQENIELLAARDIEEDELLLSRKQEKFDIRHTVACYKSKAILIAGAAGSAGSVLSEYLTVFSPRELLLLDNDTQKLNALHAYLQELHPSLEITQIPADIRDRAKMREVFKVLRPDIVFHAAANKYSDQLEDYNNYHDGFSTNVFGTQNLVECAFRHGVSRFVFFSSDKAVGPTFYGATKKVGELMMQAYQGNGTKFITVRPSNFLGSQGSIVPIVKDQLAQGGPVRYQKEDNPKRYYITIPEAVQTVIQAGAVGKDSDIFIVSFGEKIQLNDLVGRIIEHSGKDVATENMPLRPGDTVDIELMTEEEKAHTRHRRGLHDKLVVIKPHHKKGMKDLRAAFKSLVQRIDDAPQDMFRRTTESGFTLPQVLVAIIAVGLSAAAIYFIPRIFLSAAIPLGLVGLGIIAFFKFRPDKKVRRIKELFGKNVIKDELDLDYDFQQLVEHHRREKFLLNNEGGERVLEWYPCKIDLASLFRCTCDCAHCIFRDSKPRCGEMSLVGIQRLLNMQDIFVSRPIVHLFGGEVTLRKDLKDIIRKFPVYAMATNASLMVSQDKADRFIIDLKEAVQFQRAVGTKGFVPLKIDKNHPKYKYHRKWAEMQMAWNRMEQSHEGRVFQMYVSFDDFHLAQPACSVEKIANLINAAITHYPELDITFITFKGQWEDAYPVLQDKLKEEKYNLKLSYSEQEGAFIVRRKDGFEKKFTLGQQQIGRAGAALELDDAHFEDL